MDKKPCQCCIDLAGRYKGVCSESCKETGYGWGTEKDEDDKTVFSCKACGKIDY